MRYSPPVDRGTESWPHQRRPAAGTPQGALILFHGRGTSEFDLLPLLDELDPERRLAGLAPRGPLSLPPGGAHWYLVERVGFPDPTTVFDTFEQLGATLDTVPEELGRSWEKIV